MKTTQTNKIIKSMMAVVIPGVLAAGLLTGCASDYAVDPNTKEVTVVLPASEQNNEQITALKYALIEKYHHTKIGVIQVGNELRVIYPSDLLFGVGNAQLLEHSQAYIDMFMGEVKNNQAFTYLIEGLTDNSGSQASNLKLSEKRAQSVADYMESLGMSAEELKVKGYGGLYPVADNKTKQGRAKNRRIVITVLLKQSATQSLLDSEEETAPAA